MFLQAEVEIVSTLGAPPTIHRSALMFRSALDAYEFARVAMFVWIGHAKLEAIASTTHVKLQLSGRRWDRRLVKVYRPSPPRLTGRLSRARTAGSSPVDGPAVR